MKFAVSACKVGYIAVGVSEKGVCRVSFGTSPEALKKEFEQVYPDIEEVQTLEQLDMLLSWFQDPSVSLKDCELDLKGTPFQLKVWEALRQISAGETWTYGRLAQAIGKPTASRASSAACSHNTIAIFVPCHRVIRGDGAPTGYRWGPDIKTALLEHETTVNPEDAMVDPVVEESNAETSTDETATDETATDETATLDTPEAATEVSVGGELSGGAEVQPSGPETAEVQGRELSQEQESEKDVPDTETSPAETETSSTETSPVEPEETIRDIPTVVVTPPLAEHLEDTSP